MVVSYNEVEIFVEREILKEMNIFVYVEKFNKQLSVDVGEEGRFISMELSGEIQVESYLKFICFQRFVRGVQLIKEVVKKQVLSQECGVVLIKRKECFRKK